MNANQMAAALGAMLLAGAVAAAPAGAQTLFTTNDYRQDRALWTDPAYYRNNTFEELRDMQVEDRYGEEGSGQPGALDLASPYSYTSAWEHYQAWLEAADGGTRHTYETMPDWRGFWTGGQAPGLRGGDNPASDIAAMLTPQHQEYFVQAVKAAAEGRDWWPGAFCLPTGFISSLTATDEFIVTPHRVWILGSSNNRLYTRWIYTDGSGHVDGAFKFPKWLGESIGFWDGDALIIHTEQIRGWRNGAFEYTDNMTAVERYQRVGDTIQGEITLYDPEVFVRPFHTKITYRHVDGEPPELRPLFNTCTDTNGPSNKVFLSEEGIITERLPGDPDYWDPTDLRPWAAFFNLGEERYRRARELAQ